MPLTVASLPAPIHLTHMVRIEMRTAAEAYQIDAIAAAVHTVQDSKFAMSEPTDCLLIHGTPVSGGISHAVEMIVPCCYITNITKGSAITQRPVLSTQSAGQRLDYPPDSSALTVAQILSALSDVQILTPSPRRA